MEPPQPKKGWLQKKGENYLNPWSKRFFVLNESGLSYYLSEDINTPAKGTVSTNNNNNNFMFIKTN